MMTAPDHARFMGISGTNEDPGIYFDNSCCGALGHHLLNFSQRCLPSDATVPSALRPGCWGMPWEDIVRFAQVTNKNIWVNAPISATSCPTGTPAGGIQEGVCTTLATFPDPASYYYQWAQLFKAGNNFTDNKGVPTSTAIYIEHGNEVRKK